MELLKQTVQAIEPAYAEAVKKAQMYVDSLTKPVGSLGTLEEITVKMAGITGKVHNTITKKNVIVMCSDNGVVEEGVTTCTQEITAILTEGFTRGVTGVCTLAKHAGAEITVVDVGIARDMDNPQIIRKKTSYGTRNMAKGPAMTREEAVTCIEAGIEVTEELIKKGYDLFGTGEMGVGNTTTSSAVLSVLSGLEPEIVVGRGSGITDSQMETKRAVIKKAIEINRPDKNDAIDVIAKVGGFDIAGMCGCFLAAAKNRVPIVIDGFISSAAALCAYRINKNVRDYMFPSHLSLEPGMVYAMKEIGLEPMVNLKMRLGEGSGCPLAFNIIEASLFAMSNMATFSGSGITTDDYVDAR